MQFRTLKQFCDQGLSPAINAASSGVMSAISGYFITDAIQTECRKSQKQSADNERRNAAVKRSSS